jgi:hypothetical protein
MRLVGAHIRKISTDQERYGLTRAERHPILCWRFLREHQEAGEVTISPVSRLCKKMKFSISRLTDLILLHCSEYHHPYRIAMTTTDRTKVVVPEESVLLGDVSG